MFTPPSDMISEKAGMRILTKIDVANVGGGLNTSTAVLQKSRPQLLRFLRGYMEAIQYMKSHKDESLKIFSRYVRNPDLSIMAYLYEEIASRVETGTQAAIRRGARDARLGGIGLSAGQAVDRKR